MRIVDAILADLREDPELGAALAAVLAPHLPDGRSTAGTPMLDAEDAAKLLGYSPEHLKRYARAGLVPGATKPGNAWRFPANIAETFDVSAARLPREAARPTSRPRPARRAAGTGSLADVVRGS